MLHEQSSYGKISKIHVMAPFAGISLWIVTKIFRKVLYTCERLLSYTDHLKM